MRNVVPDLLWIGNAMDVADLSPIFDAGIEAIVDLALNVKPARLTRELIYCRFPMNDGGGNSPQLLRAAVGGPLEPTLLAEMGVLRAADQQSVLLLSLRRRVRQERQQENRPRVWRSNRPLFMRTLWKHRIKPGVRVCHGITGLV